MSAVATPRPSARGPRECASATRCSLRRDRHSAIMGSPGPLGADGCSHWRDRTRMVRRDPLRGDRRHSESRARRALHAHAGAAQGDGDEVRREEDDARLPRPARRSRHRRGLDRHHVGPAHRARSRRARSRQARLPREADGVDGRGLPRRSSPPPRGRRASSRSATSAASTRATAWPSRRSPRARSARSSR